jgi:hypothetical protein
MILDRSAALVVAHPGHELRALGWLRLARPVVYVLTDGSGAMGCSRVPSTKRVLDETGARCGSIFGRFTDREVYARLMRADIKLFIELAEELTAAFVNERIEYIVGDASEGYNPTHDVCRLIIDAVIARVRAITGRDIPSYDFTLVGRPDECAEDPHAEPLWIHLDDEMLARKIETASAYPEMAGEVEAAIAKFGTDMFRIECFRPVAPGPVNDPDSPPFYETYGKQRVQSGVYVETLRYGQHIKPLVASLHEWATAGVQP